jgi:hypothetical protein
MILDPKVVAQGWLDLHVREPDLRERVLGAWASDVLREAIDHDAEYALQIIDAIHELDSKQEAVAAFSAGPVEDLLASQGANVIDEMELRARRDPSFAFVLGGVWKNAMTDEVWSRVLACREMRGWDGIPR